MSQNKLVKALNSWITLLAQTQGRDGVCRLFQYGTLCLSEYYKQTNNKDLEKSVMKYKRISNQMRMIRKIFRFARTLQYFRKITDIIKKLRQKREKPIVQSLMMITQAFSFLFTLLFYVFDHLVCLAEIGVISQDNLKINFEKSYRFWFLQCFFSISRDLCQCLQMITNQKQIQKKDEQKFRQILLNIIKNFLDLLISYSVLKGGPLRKLNIGSVGFITSVIRLCQIWK